MMDATQIARELVTLAHNAVRPLRGDGPQMVEPTGQGSEMGFYAAWQVNRGHGDGMRWWRSGLSRARWRLWV